MIASLRAAVVRPPSFTEGLLPARQQRSSLTSWVYALAISGATLARTAVWAALCPKVCCTADIGGLALVLRMPGRAFVPNRTFRSRPRITSADTRLALAIRSSASGASEAMLCVARARACASRWIQCTAVLTPSHTPASLIDPLLYRRLLANQAIAVLDRFGKRFRSVVIGMVPVVIHVRDELRDGQEGIADRGSGRIEVATIFPFVEDRLGRVRLAHLALESAVTAQGSAFARLRL